MHKKVEEFKNLLDSLGSITTDNKYILEDFLKEINDKEVSSECFRLFMQKLQEDKIKQQEELDKKKESAPYNYDFFYSFQYLAMPFLYYSGDIDILASRLPSDQDLGHQLYEAYYEGNETKTDDMIIPKKYFNHKEVTYDDITFDIFSFEDEIFNIEPLAKYIVLPKTTTGSFKDAILPRVFFTFEVSHNAKSLYVCATVPKEPSKSILPFTRFNFGSYSTFEDAINCVVDTIETQIQRSFYGDKVYEA